MVTAPRKQSTSKAPFMIKKFKKTKPTTKPPAKLQLNINNLCKEFKNLNLRNNAQYEFSKDLVNKLHEIYLLSNSKRIEFSGSINPTTTPQSIMSKNATTHTRGGCNLPYDELITFHTHPTTQSYKYLSRQAMSKIDLFSEILIWDFNEKPPRPKFTQKFLKDLFTLPSDTDMQLYLKTYPRTQINVILDHNGYYVIDYHGVETDKYGTITDESKTKVINAFNDFKIRLSGYVIHISEIVTDKSTRSKEKLIFEYHHVNKESFINFINSKPIQDIFSKAGVRFNYYSWVGNRFPTFLIKSPENFERKIAQLSLQQIEYRNKILNSYKITTNANGNTNMENATARPKTARPATARPKTARPATARPRTARPATARTTSRKPPPKKPKQAWA